MRQIRHGCGSEMEGGLYELPQELAFSLIPLPSKFLFTTHGPALLHRLPQAFQTPPQSTTPPSVLRIHISTCPLQKQ